MSFKQYFMGAATLAFATTVQAEPQSEDNYPANPPEVILEQENYSVLKLGSYGGDQSPNANTMITLCPPAGLADIFTKSGAAVLLMQAKPENMEESYKTLSSSFQGNVENIPNVSLSFIDNKNSFVTMFTPDAILEEVKKRADGQVSMEGSPTRNPQLLANINKYVQDFCFSNF